MGIRNAKRTHFCPIVPRPILNPNPAERKDIAVKFSVENTWIGEHKKQSHKYRIPETKYPKNKNQKLKTVMCHLSFVVFHLTPVPCHLSPNHHSMQLQLL